MSNSNSDPKDCQCSNFHLQALKAYLPPSVLSRLEQHNLSDDDMDTITTSDYLKTFFEKGLYDMRRYGSVTELDASLKSFKNFIGSDRELQGAECTRFDRTPQIFKDADGNSYMAKQDAVVALQEYFLKEYPFGDQKELLTMVLFAWLKCHESTITEILEFTPAGDPLKVAFQVDIDRSEHWFWYPKKYDLPSILAGMEMIIGNFEQQDHPEICILLQVMHFGNSEKENAKKFKEIFHKMNKLVSHVNQVTTLNLPIFVPNCETPEIRKPHILRQFNDGDRSFVMVDEVARVVPVQRGNDRKLRTMALDCAKKMTNNKPIFILCPIQRDIHISNLIRTPDEGYCKLAVDLLFETLDEWIFGSKIFQKMQESEWSMVERFFAQQKHHFDPDEKNIYFVRMSDFKADESMRNRFFNSIVNRPAKQIRNAKADGFTVQNLKNEMVKQLELNRLFPEIEGYAETAYEYVMLHKKERVLRTCDLFDAIKHCVLMSLFEKLPKLNTFLHNQNGCRRVLVTTCCSKSPLLSVIPKVFESPEATTSNLEVPSSSAPSTSAKSGSTRLQPSEKPKERAQSPPEPKKPAPKDCKTCEPLSQKNKKLLDEIKELKSKLEEMKSKVAQADKNAKALKKKEQAMKPMKDLEKENRDLLKRITEMEEEKLAREEKDKEHERQHEAANKMIEELTKNNSELQQFNTEKDVKIAKLKEKFSKEELKTFNFELSSEMRQELGVLQSKLDYIRANDPVGHAASQVHELKINTNDAHVQGGADHVLLVFKMEFSVYEAAIERNIGIIQADTSVLRSELVEVPALPELPPVFYTELRKAYARKNAERAKECLICLTDEDREFFYCESCPIKAHYDCLIRWWQSAGSRKCPHCKCDVE